MSLNTDKSKNYHSNQVMTQSGKTAGTKNFFVIIIIALTLFISYLHYSTLPFFHELHNILTELYYIPLLLGALAFGLKGAVLTFLIITVLYTPYVLINWSVTYLFIANKLLHALFLGSFAILAGILIDRERKRQKQTEKDRYLAGLGRAAAAIVHDLRNPLITIQGFTKRIQEKKGNIETALQALTDSIGKMQNIMNDVLDFAKPIRLEYNKEDLNSFIQQVCDSCRTNASEKEVIFSLDLHPDPVNFVIDKIRMERAITNLLNNAIDASQRGHIVTVSAKPEKDSIAIKIKDSGSGMDKETLESIFIPFYSRKNNGTGLGMAIAKKIIEDHQGKIHIDSQPGIGTEAIIELPDKLIHTKN
jgi:signal transduction histidine kinase